MDGLIVNKLTLKSITAIRGVGCTFVENIRNPSNNGFIVPLDPGGEMAEWSKATVC